MATYTTVGTNLLMVLGVTIDIVIINLLVVKYHSNFYINSRVVYELAVGIMCIHFVHSSMVLS